MREDPSSNFLPSTSEPLTAVEVVSAEPTSADVSAGRVALIGGGDRPRFSDETALLLRQRLGAVSLIASACLAVIFAVRLLDRDNPLFGLRAGVLAIQVVCAVLARSRWPLSLRPLRVMEAVVFGALALQTTLVGSAFMLGFAARGDVASVVGSRQLYLGTWAVLVMTYGMFIPNTWRRAAAVVFPACALPFVILAALRWLDRPLADALRLDHTPLDGLSLWVAGAVAVYGTHAVNAIRREAFRARRFGQYVLKGRIGSGGMGEVYEAEHRLLKRPCALKLIRQDRETDEKALARFEAEVRATARLSHPNTVEIYDYGRTDDGTFYYVMELLRGMSLEDLVRRHGPLPPGRVVHLVRQVCGALCEAHAAGLVHRDIKPANIYAAERGGVYDVAKLLDFGLVKEIQGGHAGDASPGHFLGSPLYMAPEQAKGYNSSDARSDLYAVGGVAYYLLTGRPPFPGDSLMEVLRAHARQPVVPPSQLRPDAPVDLERVVMRCLDKRPESRYPDAAALARALAACSCAGDWSDEDAAGWWLRVSQPAHQASTVPEPVASPGGVGPAL
jgi:serine/threonine-protein kinase